MSDLALQARLGRIKALDYLRGKDSCSAPQKRPPSGRRGAGAASAQPKYCLRAALSAGDAL